MTTPLNEMKTLLQRGKEIQEQINILGDDGVPVDYHEQFWKAEVIDFVILQQDAFDKIDAVCPLERQEYMLDIVMDICRHDYDFDNFVAVNEYFKRVINLLKQMNYSEFHSEQFKDYEQKLAALLAEKQIAAGIDHAEMHNADQLTEREAQIQPQRIALFQ